MASSGKSSSGKTQEQIDIENEKYAQSLEKKTEEKLKQQKNMLINQIKKTIDNIDKVFKSINSQIDHINNILKHYHIMHLHALSSGHKYSVCTNDDCKKNNKQKCEKCLGCFYCNTIPYVSILYMEYMTMKDCDGNGLVFFKDFYIDYLDKNAPLLLRNLIYVIYFPDTYKYPYKDSSGNDIKFDINTINYDFKWDGRKFTYKSIDRQNSCTKMTWQEYLNTL